MILRLTRHEELTLCFPEQALEDEEDQHKTEEKVEKGLSNDDVSFPLKICIYRIEFWVQVEI